MEENSKRKLPQLVMKKDNLINLPQLVLPIGYSVRTYKPGDEYAWDSIIKDAFNWEGVSFKDTILSKSEFLPERVFFICYDDIPIATATAWYDPKWGDTTGYLHMVGVAKKHTGKGLGFQVSLAALHQMAKEGREFAVLQTDDFRLPAIKTYLKLGFKPVIVDENQIERWNAIFKQMGINDVSAEYGVTT